MWAEKYRPQSLNEMVNQKEIVERLKSFVQAHNIPHCIFAGPPGTGKTFLATQIADLFGCDSERVTATDDWSTYDTIGGLVHKGNDV